MKKILLILMIFIYHSAFPQFGNADLLDGLTSTQFSPASGSTYYVHAGDTATMLSVYLSKGGNLSGLGNAATARTNLGVSIGSDVLAYSAQIQTIAGLSNFDDNFLQRKSSAWATRTIAQVKVDLFATATVLATGTTTLAPLRFGSGTNLTSPLNGVMEYDGTNLYFTPSSATRRTVAYTSNLPVAGSFSGAGTATTTFTVTIGTTQANTTYKVNVTPTSALSAAAFYVTTKTTTTFVVTYLAGLTGTVTFDWAVFP